MNFLPSKLPHRCSYVAVPSTQSGQPLLHFGILRGDSLPSLSVATTRSRYRSRHPKTKAYIGRQNSMRISRHASGSHISHFFPIRELSLTVLKREEAGAAAAGIPMPIFSSDPSTFGGLAAGGGGRMMLVGVVYRERVGRCLQQLLYIYM